ncbi:MAG: hypothetical protein AAGG75_09245 [Bacteroidota bacterium]
MKIRFSLFACLLLFLVSCTNNNKVDEQATLSPQLEGQEIFKTIFFSLGEKAQDIPSFETNVLALQEANEEDPTFLETYETNVDGYVTQIEELHPGYFNQLKEAVYSEDFGRIRDAMEFGSSLMLPAVVMSSMEDIEDENLKSDLEALNMEAVDFKSEDQLNELSRGLAGVLAKYDADYNPTNINNGRCLFFAAAVAVTFAAVGNFVYAVNVAWTGNINWNVNVEVRLEAAEQEQQIGDGQVAAYGNYIGEELIKDVAVAFAN